MSKWLVQTLCDSKLATHLPNYTFNASNLCDEEELVSFDEGHNGWLQCTQIMMQLLRMAHGT